MDNKHLVYGLASSEHIIDRSKGYKRVIWGFQFFEQMTNVWVVFNHNKNNLYRLYESDVDNVIFEGDYYDVIKKLNEGFSPKVKIYNK